MQKYILKSVLPLTLFFTLSNVYAGSYNTLDDHFDSSQVIESTLANDYAIPGPRATHCQQCWFIGGGIGAANESNQNNTYDLNNGSNMAPPKNVDPYNVTSNPWAPTLALEGGYRWSLDTTFPKSVSVGLRYQFFLNTKTEGTLTELSNYPTFTNYDFTLESVINVLTLFTKINLTNFDHFSPYVTLGVGGEANSMTNYSDNSTGATDWTSPAFANSTTFGFALDAGLGVDYYFKRAYIFSVGYDYLYLSSNLQTGNGTNDWSNSTLNFGSLSINSVMAKISYLFNT